MPGTSRQSLPVPATFVFDPDGIVRARHVHPNKRERMPVEDILAAIEAIRGSAS